MKETLNKPVLTDEKFILEVYLKQPEFVYGECRSLRKLIK